MADLSNLGSAFMAPILANQEYQQKAANQPAELAQKLASTRYTTALADRVETETASDKKAAALMAQMAGGSPQTGGTGSISSRLLQMSDVEIQSNNPAKAAMYAQQAAQAQAHEATARSAQVREAYQKVQIQDKQIGMVSKLLGDVKDEDSWRAANDTFSKETGQESPFANVPYDPKVVKMLQDSATTAHQKNEEKIAQERLKAVLADTGSKLAARATNQTLTLEKLRALQQKELRDAKAGGKDVGSPKPEEIKAAGRLLNDSGLDGDEKDTAAFSIASEALAIRRKNPGVSSDEALRQAKAAAVEAGDIVPGAPSRIPWMPGKRGDPAPSKFTTPQALPDSKDTKDLTIDGHYVNAAGVVKIWDGKVFKEVGKTTPKAAPKSRTASVPDDDDEEDDGTQ